MQKQKQKQQQAEKRLLNAFRKATEKQQEMITALTERCADSQLQDVTHVIIGNSRSAG